MTLLDIVLPYQQQFVLAKKKRKIWLSSRQVGKSFGLAFIAAMKAATKQNGLALCVSTGARAASELVKKCIQMAEAVKMLSNGLLDYSTSADCVKFSNGSRVLSLPSGNPSALRGYSAQAILLDECAFIERPDDVFAAIAPTLTRDPDAELIVASTPAGKSGFFWKLWNEAGDDWYKQRTTIDDAVAQGLEVDIAELEKLVGDQEVFDIEYRCKFADSWSSMIDLKLLDWYDELPDGAKTAYLGMDVGSTSDRTALVTLKELLGTFYVDDIVVMHKASYESQMSIVKQLHEREKYTSGYIDQNGIGSALAEFVSKQISSRLRGFTQTSSNKTPSYEALRAAIFDHKLKFNSKFRSIIEEDFQNVHRIVSETGKVQFEAGRSKQGHSDVTSAIVLALQAAKDNPVNLVEPQSYMRFSSLGQWHSRF